VKKPALVNATHTTLDGTLELAAHAADHGAAALLVMPPWYFRYSSEDLRAFYLAFAEQWRSRLPLWLYNIPFFASELKIELAEELLATGAWAGMKDSSGSLDYFRRLQQHPKRAQFQFFVGNDAVVATAAQEGADGVVSGCAAAVPELLHAIWSQPADSELRRLLSEFLDMIDRVPTPIGVQEAARVRGHWHGAAALPIASPRLAALRESLHQWMPGMLQAVAPYTESR
jgi:2-dehydro-3-deoxy-D-pentonate aldolase